MKTLNGSWLLIAGLIWFGVSASVAGGAEPKLRRDEDARAEKAKQGPTTEQKRDFLKEVFRRQLSNPKNLRDVEAKLDRMSPKQIDALVAELEQQQQQLAQQRLLQAQIELARAQAYRDYFMQLQQQRAYGGGGVGFAPVITWLPEGVTLGASAVVSPDRRYVRITAMPFFSSVPSVSTFNFRNGKSFPAQNINGSNSGSAPVRRERTWDDGRR